MNGQEAQCPLVHNRSLKPGQSKGGRVWSLIRGERELSPVDFHMEETDPGSADS